MPEMVNPYIAKSVLVPEGLVSRYLESGFSVVKAEPEKKPTSRKSRKSDS